jgi:hypothetical protein
VPGDPFTPGTLDAVRRRLIDTGRFEGIEVRRRYASIADPSQIALVIIVDEHAVRTWARASVQPSADPLATPLEGVRFRSRSPRLT